MEGNTVSVKATRRYDSSRRRKQALRTRETVLDAARHLFLGGGYAGTTIASIAEAADVSVDTIYKTFGGKAGLVRAIAEKGLEGADRSRLSSVPTRCGHSSAIRTGSCSVGARS